MKRHELLGSLHRVLEPRTYFEVGVRNGASLQLARCQSVAVDPFFKLTHEVRCDVHLVRTTSDEFFARRQPFAHYHRPGIDLAFIDGLHLAEFALRDFINTERHCHPGSVVVLDDVLPRNPTEAGRSQKVASEFKSWAGDVYKLVGTLRTLRPDLVVAELGTTPTGTLLVANLDPRSTVLLEAYDDLVATLVTPDPQEVPEAILTRSRAISPEDLLADPVWPRLRQVRRLPRGAAAAAARRLFERSDLLSGAVA